MGKVLIWFVIIISTVVLYCLMKVKDISFTPTISLYYAYPVTSTYVEDDVVIIQ